jgi:hypothetical protein
MFGTVFAFQLEKNATEMIYCVLGEDALTRYLLEISRERL